MEEITPTGLAAIRGSNDARKVKVLSDHFTAAMQPRLVLVRQLHILFFC